AAHASLTGQAAQDAAPYRAVGAPAVVQHHDGSRGHVVDKVTHRAYFARIDRGKTHRIGRPQHARRTGHATYAQRASRQVKKVQGIGDLGSAEFAHGVVE